MSQRPHRERPSTLHPSERIPDWLAGHDFSDQERRIYSKAAHRMGMEVGHWARQVLNRAARVIAGATRTRGVPITHAASAAAHADGHHR
jgi:hypothetical protein